MSAPETDQPEEQIERALVETTVDAFRLLGFYRQLLAKVDPKLAERYAGRADYLASRMERNLKDAGLVLTSVSEGEPYDPGMAVTALNIDEFDPSDEGLVIDQILEPIVLNRHGVRRMGTVLLRRDS